MKTWILVANSAVAQFFDTDNLRVGELKFIRELVHPESRKKISELITDKAGSYKVDAESGGSFIKADPKEVEAEHFALQITNELRSGWDQGQYKSLVIVAPAHFYALIKKHLHGNVQLKLTHIAKDYTKYAIPKLQSSLREQLLV